MLKKQINKISIPKKTIIAVFLVFTFLFSVMSPAHAVKGTRKDGSECVVDANDSDCSTSWRSPAKIVVDAAIGWVGDQFIDMLIGLRLVCASLLATAVNLLNLMIDGRIYDEVFFSPMSRAAIATGWGLVRDFVNMFYILILLFLAIATILRVNKFSDKKLIVTLVLSALLVNFSMPITLAVIDASNLAMNFFARQISDVSTDFGVLLVQNSQLGDAAIRNSFKNEQGAFVAAFAEVIFTAIFAITIFVLALSLLVRLIAFWILIVLSPLAFFGLAMPGTGLSGVWNNWLSKLINYSFFGPILLFFLWLALVLITALVASKKAAHGIPELNGTPVATGGGLDAYVISIFGQVIPFAASVYMLFYGFGVAKKMAESAGGAAGGIFGRGQNWLNKGLKVSALAGTGFTAYGAYKVGQYGGKRLGEKATAVGRGLKSRIGFSDQEERKRKDEELQARVSGGEKLQEFNRKRVAEQAKDWKDKGAPSAQEKARIDSSGSQIERMALSHFRAENGELNTEADYRRAVEAMGNDRVSLGKLRSAAVKKNLDAVMRHELRLGNSVTAAGSRDEDLDAAIETNGTLADVIRNEENATQVIMNPQQRRNFLRGLNAAGNLNQRAYQSRAENMTISEIGSQNLGYFRNDEAMAAIKAVVDANPNKKRQFRTLANRDMNSAKTAELTSRHII